MKQHITDLIEWITDICSHTYVTLTLLVVVLALVVYGFIQGWPKEYADHIRLLGSTVSMVFLILNLNDNHRTSEANQARLIKLTKEDKGLRDLENRPFEDAEKVKHREAGQ